MEHAPVYISLVTLVLNLVVVVVGGSIWAASVKYETREYAKKLVEQAARDLGGVIKEISKELHQRIDEEIRSTGEVGIALRNKIHEFELFVRDNFLSKRTFELLMSEVKATIERTTSETQKRLDRIDKKLESRDAAD